MINLLRASVILSSNLPTTASAYPMAPARITTYLPHLLQLHKEEIAKYLGYEVFCRNQLLPMDFQIWNTTKTTNSTHSVESVEATMSGHLIRSWIVLTVTLDLAKKENQRFFPFFREKQRCFQSLKV